MRLAPPQALSTAPRRFLLQGETSTEAAPAAVGGAHAAPRTGCAARAVQRSTLACSPGNRAFADAAPRAGTLGVKTSSLGVKSMEAASDQLGIGNPILKPSPAQLAQLAQSNLATSAAANGAPNAAPQQISGSGGWELPPAGALAGPDGGLVAPAGGWSAATMGPHPWPQAPAGAGWGGRSGGAGAPGAWAGAGPGGWAAGGGGAAAGGGGGGYVNAYSPVTSAHGAGFYAAAGLTGASGAGVGASEAAAVAAEMGAPSAGVVGPAVNKKAAFAANNPTVSHFGRIFGRRLRALAAAARRDNHAVV